MKFIKREIIYENLYSDMGILISNKRTKSEVVRCGSCEHWSQNGNGTGTCKLESGLKSPTANEFCSRGKFGEGK